MHDKMPVSPQQVQRARRLNRIYQRRLGWTVPPGWTADVTSATFARRVAALQAEQPDLIVDGVLGPKTWSALRGRSFVPPVGDQLIIGGKRVRVPFPVVTWNEPEGLSFYGHGGWRPRRDPSGHKINLLVLHWDGCTSAHQCFQVLLQRGLSAHLMLDGDGTVYQALDLAETRAWHAGHANERSIGLEVNNPVRLHRNRWQKPPRPIVTEPRVHARKLRAPRLLRHPEEARRRALRGSVRALRHPPCAAPGRQ